MAREQGRSVEQGHHWDGPDAGQSRTVAEGVGGTVPVPSFPVDGRLDGPVGGDGGGVL